MAGWKSGNVVIVKVGKEEKREIIRKG